MQARLDRRAFIGLIAGVMTFPRDCFAQASHEATEAVRAILASSHLDYLQAKIALDRIIDPQQDDPAVAHAVEQLAAQARALAGANADEAHKVAAVRAVIYQPGPWNDNRAFAYDQADPLGHDVRNKLLATYLRTRLGNCVSMPILFLLLADKLGLNVSLARAPHHLFIRWRERDGHEVNLECTSGGLPARDVYYRESLPPITDAAIANGVYLHALSRRENVAAMATTVAEYFYVQRRFQDAIDVCTAILAASPHDAATMVLAASSYGGLIHDEFELRFPTPVLIPPSLRARYEALEAANERLFVQAEALGWQEGS